MRALGVEPAFARNGTVWPLAGHPAFMPREADDPACLIPEGILALGDREARDSIELASTSPQFADQPKEPLAPPSTAVSGRRKKWTAALVASCVFHAAVAAFFLFGYDEGVLIEGGEQAQVALLGAAEEEVAAGDPGEMVETEVTNITLIEMVQPKPVETVDAEPVEPVESIQPEEITPAEIVVAEMAMPAETVMAETPVVETAVAEQPEPVVPEDQPVEVAPVPAPIVPEILATDTARPVEDDNIVAPRVETLTAEPVETVEAEPVEPVEPLVETKPEPVVEKPKPEKPKPEKKVAEKPEPKKPTAKEIAAREKATKEKAEKAAEAKAEKAKAAKEKAAKAKAAKEKAAKEKQVAAKGGSGGAGKTNARRGANEGSADGTSAASKGSKRSSAAGNAAVSNYPGKIVSKLRRALRYPAAARREGLRGEVQVAFTVSASGGVGGVRIVRSSGSPVLDKAALETVRRAAPFPAIPADAGRSSWPFTVPLAFTR